MLAGMTVAARRLLCARFIPVLLTTLVAITTLCALPANTAAAPGFRLQALPGTFADPVWAGAPAGDARLFVVERRGVIKILVAGRVRTFVDLRDRVNARGGEQGLLSIEFHGNFAQNGRYWVYFTNARGDGQVLELRARGNNGGKASARRIITIPLDRRFSNHNGGSLELGPDGLLYIGTGDGGSAGDPDNNAQRRGVLMGKLLRLDVDRGYPYRIPRSNPYRGKRGTRAEIWAIGLRNPWRIAFDRVTRDLWVGDVGQGAREEVNRLAGRSGGRVAPGGANFGWRRFEGTLLYSAGTTLASGTRHHRPLVQYSHADGCSITGGLVYRGARIRTLRGYYLYADFCSQWIRGVRRTGSGRFTRELGVGAIVSFGETGTREVVVASLSTGRVYRLMP